MSQCRLDFPLEHCPSYNRQMCIETCISICVNDLSSRDLNISHRWCCHCDNFTMWMDQKTERVILMTFEFCSNYNDTVSTNARTVWLFWRMPHNLISMARHAVPCKQRKKYYKINYVEIKFNYCFRFSNWFKCRPLRHWYDRYIGWKEVRCTM